MIKRTKTIPTLIGLIVLILGLAAGVLLIEGNQAFRLGAKLETAPKDIRVSNISSSQATISWTTNTETFGFIIWGKKPTNLARTLLSETGKSQFIHTATIEGLEPTKPYYFKINSGGSIFDNEGIPWTVTTGDNLLVPNQPNLVSGIVLTPVGSPAKNILVYATVGGGALLSALTSGSGNWVIPISQARIKDLTSYIQIIEAETLLEFSVQGGPFGVASAQIYPETAKPAPPIILGQTHNFKNLSPQIESIVPEASIELPPEATPSSRFQLETSTPTEEKSVTLENIKEGQILSDPTSLSFSGEGPPGANLTITIESDPISEELIVNQTGNWNWSLPEALSNGIHTITITWRDASGILQTLERSFTISAKELSSPTPSPSLTPAPSPTFTPTPTQVKSAEDSGLPEAGSLTPTILLSMIGLGSITLGGIIFTISFRNRSK